jgi:hypothetical protein
MFMNKHDRDCLSATIKLGKDIFAKYYRPGEPDEYRLFHAEEMVEAIKEAKVCNQTRREYINVIVAYMYQFTSQKERFNREIKPVYMVYLKSLTTD